MCGICGVFKFDGRPVAITDLEPMNERMRHRGPDSEGSYINNAAGLAMRRLAIIDLSGGNQPIANEDQSVWVVMNGEIYNHVELRENLRRMGHRFKTLSDTETIVHLYEEYGFDAVHQLNGMFAFALYDTKKQQLWIVRDRIGIKPLFYTLNDKELRFASSLDSLISHAQNLPLDSKAFLHYLALGYISEPMTAYKDIKKLPSGHWLVVDREGARQKQYWDIANFQNWRGSVQEAGVELKKLLRDSVRLELRSDVPIGVFLSGGIDSSAITALASQETPHPLRTFTINFSEKFSKDAFFARQIAQRYKTDHQEIPLSPAAIDALMDELMPFLDEPIADSAILPTYLIAKIAGSQGIKVLLTGAGGDELFGGYGRHHSPPLGSPDWVAAHVPFSLRGGFKRVFSIFNDDWAFRAANPMLSFGVAISGVSPAACMRILKKPSLKEELLSIFHETYQDIAEKQKEMGSAYARMRNDFRRYLVGNILALTDKMTMACSVEARVPLLDHRLAEFAFALPQKTNLLNGRPKGLLRYSLSEWLDNGILERKKEGFGAPMSQWAIHLFGQKMKEELLKHPIEPFEYLCNFKELEKLLSGGRQMHRATFTLFNLYIFSKWHRSRAHGHSLCKTQSNKLAGFP